MAQKVNPIAVRLGFNRSPDSSWFSDYYYASLLYQDLNLRDYLNSIRPPAGNQFGFRTGRCIIHHYPKRSLIHLFCLTGATSALSSLRAKQAARMLLASCCAPLGRLSSQTKQSRASTLRTASIGAPPKGGPSGRVPSVPPFSLLTLSDQKLQPVMAKYTTGEGSTIFSSTAKQCLSSGPFEPQKDQNISIDRLEVNPLNHFDCNTYLSFVQKKGYVAKRRRPSEVLKTRSVGPLHEINPLLILNYWKQFKSNQVQIVKPIKDKLTSASVSPIKTCLNYYVMKYLFHLKLNLIHNISNPSPITPRCASPVVQTKAFGVRPLGVIRSFDPKVSYLDPKTTKGEVLLREECAAEEAVLNQHSFQKEGAQLRVTKDFNSRLLKDAIFVRSPVLCQRPINKVHHYFCSNLQNILSSSTNTLTSIMPIKVNSVYRSAFLLAQEIACKLEQKKSFRQISRAIFQQIELCNYIKGIRVSCSGRLNGAEIAKTECKKYGETSLHVFSDRIDYAYTKAFTPYGILGVKVWISYL